MIPLGNVAHTDSTELDESVGAFKDENCFSMEGTTVKLKQADFKQHKTIDLSQAPSALQTPSSA